MEFPGLGGPRLQRFGRIAVALVETSLARKQAARQTRSRAFRAKMESTATPFDAKTCPKQKFSGEILRNCRRIEKQPARRRKAHGPAAGAEGFSPMVAASDNLVQFANVAGGP